MMNPEIRVQVDKNLFKLYNDFKSKIIEDFHELFFIFSVVGFHNNRKEPLKNKQPKFWSKTITPTEWTCFYSMTFESINYGEGKFDETKLIEEIEEYANGGFWVLYEDFLKNYVVKNDNEFRLNYNCSSHELMFYLVYFIHEKVSK